ncbi:MAG: hypothetical protein WC521_08220 [Bdellovibrionales bacterium]
MQVPPIPPPLIAAPLPQEAATKAVPNSQAVAPLIQHAVDPTKKTERFNEVRHDKEKPKKDQGKKDEQDKEDDQEGDHAVNIRI